MTENEIYHSLGTLINNSIEVPYQSVNLFVDRLDKYVSAQASYINNEGQKINLDNLVFGYADSRTIHELHSITCEGGKNKWNKLIFTLYPTHKFDVQFIWDQEFQDQIDKLNQKR